MGDLTFVLSDWNGTKACNIHLLGSLLQCTDRNHGNFTLEVNLATLIKMLSVNTMT